MANFTQPQLISMGPRSGYRLLSDDQHPSHH